jgi:cation/acetate symporter
MFAFYLAILVVGFGATAFVGSDTIKRAPGGANSAAPLLAYAVGGTVLLGIVAAVAFATILAVVAGLTLTASASFAHDVYASVLRHGQASPRDEVRVARWTAVAVGVLSIGGGIAAIGQNVAFLVSLALALAASANMSTLVYTLFWRRFSTSGTLWSIYGGLVSSMVLIAFPPAVSGAKDAMFPSVDFHWFPLTNPALVSVPISFLCGYLGTVLGAPDDEREASRKASEMEVRALTGIGSGLPRPQRPDEV